MCMHVFAACEPNPTQISEQAHNVQIHLSN